jgi:hypothetical protein
VGISINEGVPLAKSAPNLKLCQDLRSLASHFSEETELNGSRRSSWNWLRFLRRNK